MDKLKAILIVLLLFGMLLPSASSQVITQELRPPIIIVGNLPKNFVVGPYEEFTVYFYIADDYGITVGNGKVEVYYRINDGDWKQGYVKTAAAGENWSIYQSIIRRFYGETQNFYVFYRKVKFPGLPPGSRVEFRIEVTDVEGHVEVSPVYSYYVTNPDGPKVLIVDPSVEATAFMKSLDSLLVQFNYSRNFYYYDLSDFEAVAEPLTKIKPWMLREHHWEVLAKDYNIRIVSPEDLPKALLDFEPQVIILSNLWLPEWGLSGDALNSLEGYLKDRHAGLVVTAGTLFDATNPSQTEALSKLLGLDPLTVPMTAKEELNLTGASVMAPFISTGYSLILEREPFAGGTVEVTVPSAVGWQYTLPGIKFGIAKRSIARFLEENESLSHDVEVSLQNLLGVYVNFSLSANLVLPEIASKMQILDDGVILSRGNLEVEITPERGVLERVRLLNALRGRVPLILARTGDYAGGILAIDGAYRSAYVSLELESGTPEEREVLKELVDWVGEPHQASAPEVVILSNDIDWNIRGALLASQLETLGLPVRRVTAGEFEAYKDSEVIIILGGPDAYDGVGGYVRQVLSPGEQSAVRNGEKGMFVKTNVWTEGQVVMVLAGVDRWETSRKVKAYLQGLDPAYVRLLVTFSVSVS